MLCRAAREHRRASAMDHQTIGDIITSNMHRRCLHEHRRCVADVSGTFLTSVYIAECSPTVRRCSAIYRRWYLASNHWEKISMHALNFFSISRCLGEAWRLLAYIADHSPNDSVRRHDAGPTLKHNWFDEADLTHHGYSRDWKHTPKYKWNAEKS